MVPAANNTIILDRLTQLLRHLKHKNPSIIRVYDIFNIYIKIFSIIKIYWRLFSTHDNYHNA